MALRSIAPLVVTAAALTGAAAAWATPPAVQPPTATVEACHAAPNLPDRYATFAAQMTAIPGTAQMSIRLQLAERTPGDPIFRLVTGVPGFGVWKSSAPGVGIFGYSQEVTSLTAPATFRVNVNYRWIGPHHKVIKRAERTTATCNPTLAPSAALVVGSLSSVAPPPTG
jgi:hypothetical protein